MRPTRILALAVFSLPLLVPSLARAIPAFARKYGFNCSMCHAGFPKLNDWGQRYRDNGYQLPSQEGKEKTVFDSNTPIALRTMGGLNGYSGKAAAGAPYESTLGFNLNGLDLLAAGVLHKNVSVLVIYTPRIDEPTDDYLASGPRQPGALESANVVFSNVFGNALNLRVGRFEPAYHLVSSKRSYYLGESYEVYDFPTANNNFLFNDNQVGIEATGHFKTGSKYALGVVNGTGAMPDNNQFKDCYVTLAQTFGAGDGQVAGQRISGFAYYGYAPTGAPAAVMTPPTGDGALGFSKPYYRYGGSLKLNWKSLGLGGLYMRGFDDRVLNALDPAKDYEYEGGFAELDYAGLWNNRLVLSGLYNWVNAPCHDTTSGDVTAYSFLTRYYLGDWTAVNVALHGEYTYREVKMGAVTTTENIYSAMVDYAF